MSDGLIIPGPAPETPFPAPLGADGSPLVDPDLWRAFHPRHVAVVGASRRPGSIGRAIVDNLLRGGFTGAVLPVNPSAPAVCGVPAWPDLAALPLTPDLAVVVTPAATVPDILDAFGRRGGRAAVVITAGFHEVGPRAAEVSQRLSEVIERHELRIIGPNCMGIINMHPDLRLNATFAPRLPLPGNVAMVSQSGALGVAILDHGRAAGVGLAQFASVGNKLDVSAMDLLGMWEHVDSVEAILLYLESVGSPEAFAEAARRIGRRKPIIMVKAGRTSAGAAAAASHTAALSGSEAAAGALIEQAGITRVVRIDEMFDAARTLTRVDPPEGRRIGVLTNAGGPAIMAVDAMVGEGLELAELGAVTRERLAEMLPSEASVANPVDMIASARPDHYRDGAAALMDDEGVDAVLAIFVPPLAIAAEDVARRLADVLRARHAAGERVLPMLAVLLTEGGQDGGTGSVQTILDEVGTPLFSFPEPAVRALVQLVERGEWLARADSEPSPVHGDVAAGADVLTRALAVMEAQSEGWLPEDDVTALLAAHGIERLPQQVVALPDAVVAALGSGRGGTLEPVEPEGPHAADAFGATPVRQAPLPGPVAVASTELDPIVSRWLEQVVSEVPAPWYPLALKATGTRLVHKTEHGAVVLGLRDAGELLSQASALVQRLAAADVAPDALLFQPLVSGDVELIVGAHREPAYGPLVVVGLGGAWVEVMRDVVWQLAPSARTDLDRALTRLRSAPLLEGIRGQPAVDREALLDLLERVQGIVTSHPEVSELDLNPVLMSYGGEGAMILDARVRVQATTPPTEAS